MSGERNDNVITVGVAVEEFEEGIDLILGIEVTEDILCLFPILLLFDRVVQLPRMIEIRPVDIGLQVVYAIGTFHLKAISSPI